MYICNSTIITIKQLVYYLKNTTVVYNICILLWQHVSVYLRISSGQRTIYCGIPYYLQGVNEYGIPQYTVHTAFIFSSRTLAWRWYKERPKHVAIVRYQNYTLLLCFWRNKLIVLLWELKHNGMSSIKITNVVNWLVHRFWNLVFMFLNGERLFCCVFYRWKYFSRIVYVSATVTSRQSVHITENLNLH